MDEPKALRRGGNRHRTDGPAIEFADGSKWWWVNGRLHRTDGPAIEFADGSKEWWLDGVKMDPLLHFLKRAEYETKEVDFSQQ